MELELPSDTSWREEIPRLTPVTASRGPHRLFDSDETRELRIVCWVPPHLTSGDHCIEKRQCDGRTHPLNKGPSIKMFPGQEFHITLRFIDNT